MVTIRAATVDDAAGVANVHIESWRTTYRGIMSDGFLERLDLEKRTARWREGLGQPDRAHRGVYEFVAVDDGTVVGFVSCGPARGEDPPCEGEIWAVYLLKDHQRRGIGRRLWDAAVERLLARGYRSYQVTVLRANEACRFYEALGGRVIAHGQHNVDGVDHPDVTYGWTVD